MMVNAADYGMIISTVLPPITTTNTITSMYIQFTTNYKNTSNLSGFTNPTQRMVGDYSGATISRNGVAHVVSMTASGAWLWQ